MPDVPNILILASAENPYLAQWSDWLTHAGKHFYIVHTYQPDAIPFSIQLVITTDDILTQNINLASQLRLRLPGVKILCAVLPDRASKMLTAGADDILILPTQSAVFLNRIHLLYPPRPEQEMFVATLQQVAAALAQSLELQDVLELILSNVKRVMPWTEAANVVLIDEDGETLRIARRASYFDADSPPGAMALKRFNRSLSQVPNLLQMFQTHQPVVISNIPKEGGWVDINDTDWVRSYAGAPIVVDNSVLGFINLDSSRVGTFSAIQGVQLKAFANYAGIALRNANSFQKLTEYAADTEALVKERTDQLQREKAQLKVILDSIGDGVVYFDAIQPGKPVYINQALEDMFGFSKEEWFSGVALQELADFADEQERRAYIDEMQRALDTRGIWERDATTHRKDQSTFRIKVTVRSTMGPDGMPDGAVTVYRDITNETALLEQQARFVTYASHELRTPITNIKTRLYLLKRSPENADKHFAVIEEVIEHMDSLVNGLLSLAKLRSRQSVTMTERFNLGNVLRTVYRIQSAEATRVGVRLMVDGIEDAEVVGNQQRMIQVVTNLTTNALTHSHVAGEIHIRLQTKDAYPSPDLIQSNRDLYPLSNTRLTQRWATISVADEGEGIAEDHLPYLFQPFYRATNSRKGSGLGLAISSEIVTLHGGTISVESELDVGTTFTIWLPLENTDA